CNADLAELTDDLISKLLTDAEKTRLENGEEVKVWIEATDISASVSQTDKNLIDSKKGNTTIGMYLDIDLLKQIGSDSPVNITDTDGAVTITLKVPSSLINLNSSVTRTYQMIKVHNGVATVIPCTYDAANQTISYETDQFSTYALAYADQQNNNVKDEVPNTGDASNAYVWFILALVSGIGALYFGKKGIVLKKEN
ncbi:MAG: LPXTG cell wall anchor domain-containing protein, partial [Lachnospiraceae bacterium]|nr:LPXTG cell wall anchor domain-containing protein [Lachnospiraceae bacterium]